MLRLLLSVCMTQVQGGGVRVSLAVDAMARAQMGCDRPPDCFRQQTSEHPLVNYLGGTAGLPALLVEVVETEEQGFAQGSPRT